MTADGADGTALYYTSDFIRVEGLNNDLMHCNQLHRALISADSLMTRVRWQKKMCWEMCERKTGEKCADIRWEWRESEKKSRKIYVTS